MSDMNEKVLFADYSHDDPKGHDPARPGQAGDFDVDGGRLLKYNGPGGDVTVPEGITEIGESAFAHCDELTGVSIPESVTYIGKSAFAFCGSLTDVRIPKSVTDIGRSAFAFCTNLTCLVIPKSVECIGTAAFAGCTNLAEIRIDAGNPFYRITDGLLLAKDGMNPGPVLHSCLPAKSGVLELPEDVAQITDYAFFGCANLTCVVIPKNVEYIGASVFVGCAKLAEVQIDAGNPFYRIADGLLLGMGKPLSPEPEDKSLLPEEGGSSVLHSCLPIKSGVLTIPDGIVEIADCAFACCTKLTEIIIPESVWWIGQCAFEFCSSLTRVTIPEGVEHIGEFAFHCCTGLTHVTIPGNVTDIGPGAFENTGLSEEVIRAAYDRARENESLETATAKYEL